LNLGSSDTSGTDLADNSFGGVECTTHHPGSRGVADIVSVTMPLNTAKKYIDLAIVAQRHLYPAAHSEVIRTLNIMSIVYLLLGDKSESQKLRLEAGTLQRQIDSHALFL